VLKFIPFDATNRRTEALIKFAGDPNATIVRVTKGAVATLAVAAGIPLSSPAYERIDALVEQNARKGYKSLAVGIGMLSDADRLKAHESHDDHHAAESAHGDPHHHATPAAPSGPPQFRLLGLISIHDPPREDSAAVIAELKSLGIATKMLTGDSIGVAVEMGRQLHLGTEFINLEHEKQALRRRWQQEEEANAAIAREEAGKNKLHAAAPAGASADEVALTIGDEKVVETPAELEKRLMQTLLARFDPLAITGFAQIFPADKHAIVQYAQTKKYVCGMTGDGVNESVFHISVQRQPCCVMASYSDSPCASLSACVVLVLSAVPLL
jgi:magnesium-transporting ATPase (P-type)